MQTGGGRSHCARHPRKQALIALAIGGVVSELAAAMPHRLILVQAYWIAQRLGYRPRRSIRWADAAAAGARIRAGGWKAYARTRELFAFTAEPVAGAASIDA